MSTLKQIAERITLEQLNSILDRIDLHPGQRADMKEDAETFGVKDFILNNECLVVMNAEFKQVLS